MFVVASQYQSPVIAYDSVTKGDQNNAFDWWEPVIKKENNTINLVGINKIDYKYIEGFEPVVQWKERQ